MSVAIGFDIGSSVTKLAAVRADGTVLGLRKAEQGDSRSPEALLREFSESLGVEPSSVVLTGVGARAVHGDVADVATRRVDEFAATAAGALNLAGRERAVVLSMGTGTALLRAGPEGAVHLGGSGVGGGTLIGMCRKIYGLRSFEEIVAAAEGGSLDRVDLRIKDIAAAAYITLPPDLTSCNFGKSRDDASDADMVLGLINMILETAGVMAVMACRCGNIPSVVLTGSLTRLPQTKPLFDSFRSFFGVEFILPDDAAFATAIGAARL